MSTEITASKATLELRALISTKEKIEFKQLQQLLENGADPLTIYSSNKAAINNWNDLFVKDKNGIKIKPDITYTTLLDFAALQDWGINEYLYLLDGYKYIIEQDEIGNTDYFPYYDIFLTKGLASHLRELKPNEPFPKSQFRLKKNNVTYNGEVSSALCSIGANLLALENFDLKEDAFLFGPRWSYGGFMNTILSSRELYPEKTMAFLSNLLPILKKNGTMSQPGFMEGFLRLGIKYEKKSAHGVFIPARFATKNNEAHFRSLLALKKAGTPTDFFKLYQEKYNQLSDSHKNNVVIDLLDQFTIDNAPLPIYMNIINTYSWEATPLPNETKTGYDRYNDLIHALYIIEKIKHNIHPEHYSDALAAIKILPINLQLSFINESLEEDSSLNQYFSQSAPSTQRFFEREQESPLITLKKMKEAIVHPEESATQANLIQRAG